MSQRSKVESRKSEYQLSEALAVKDGIILNAEGHEARYRRAYKELYGCQPQQDLLENLELTLPQSGYYKLRIVYDSTNKKAEIVPYRAKNINTLKIVETSGIDYHLKYVNRFVLNNLLTSQGDCDDIIIINNGLVSDSSFGNIIFLKNEQWYTPNTPLLEGTQRENLISKGIIKLKTIKKEDIREYENVQIINALRPFNLTRNIPVQNIFF